MAAAHLFDQENFVKLKYTLFFFWNIWLCKVFKEKRDVNFSSKKLFWSKRCDESFRINFLFRRNTF